MGVLFTYAPNFYLPVTLLCCIYITARKNLLLFFLLGSLVALVHQWWVLPSKMGQETIIPNAQLQGYIVSLPNEGAGKQSFILKIHHLNGHPANALLHLSWYRNQEPIYIGEEWQFVAKIKKPRNFVNPGSHDYVQSLATKHIYWIGSIKTGKKLHEAIKTNYPWLALREYLTHQLNNSTSNERVAGIIGALTINNTQHISQDDWALFRRTGTIHLFGISGEHIAMLFGLFFFLFRIIWARSSRCCIWIPAPAFASTWSCCIAFFYALLAGFEPPVQRALTGCILYSFRYLGLYHFTPWQVWRYALLIVLCWEPHAVFMQGFYFSFLAVACLLLTNQRWHLAGYKNHLAMQLSCLIGLMPLSFYWYSYGSINGFIANLFAIPLVGFLIVPLSLLLLCVHHLSASAFIISILEQLINILFIGLKWTEHLAFLNIQWSLPHIEPLIAFMGALFIWVLLPIKPFKWLILLWCLIPFVPPNKSPKMGEALVEILDVGQGLAVSVQTQHHTLLYDTGDKFFHGSDLGQMVILPFYQARHITKLDTIVISHPDKDHRGGLESIEASIPVGQLIVNDPAFYKKGSNCHHYPQWQWDNVLFRFIPILASFKNKNNNSCVLQIITKKSSLLLTGDIEKEAEAYLVQHHQEQLKSDVLILAHHGSKTSSSPRFVLEVAPRYAIASLGFDNRFHFPHQQIVDRLKNWSIPFYKTDECGMITLNLTAEQELQPPRGMRLGCL